MSTFVSGPADSQPVTPVAAVTAGAGGDLIIRLAGELDGAVAPALGAQLRNMITADPAHAVVVDLSGVDFCDAATVRAFSAAAAAGAGGVRFRGARPHIAWLFNQLGVGHLLADG